MAPLGEGPVGWTYDPPGGVYCTPLSLQEINAAPWKLLDRIAGDYEDCPDNDVEGAISLLESLGYTVTPPCTSP